MPTTISAKEFAIDVIQRYMDCKMNTEESSVILLPNGKCKGCTDNLFEALQRLKAERE